MVKTEKFRDQVVPKYICQGFHSRFIFPIAKEVCVGKGLDIGCGKLEWAFPGSIAIDPNICRCKYDAYNLPPGHRWDYIFSSHCLEHLPNYMKALKYWTQTIKIGGTLFLYLPHRDCLYWRPHYMPTEKHLHSFDPGQMVEIFESLGYTNIFCSGRDLSYSFAIYGERL